MRGYHINNDILITSVGEELPCQRENGNPVDPFAVAVVKSEVTIGHMPRQITSVCSLFLHRNGAMTVCTTERRRFSADWPQGVLNYAHTAESRPHTHAQCVAVLQASGSGLTCSLVPRRNTHAENHVW